LSYVPKSSHDRKVEQNSRELKVEKKEVNEICRSLVGPSSKLFDLRKTRQTSAEVKIIKARYFCLRS